MSKAYKCDHCGDLIERGFHTDHRYIKPTETDDNSFQWLCQFNVHNQNGRGIEENPDLCRDCFLLYLKAFTAFLLEVAL